MRLYESDLHVPRGWDLVRQFFKVGINLCIPIWDYMKLISFKHKYILVKPNEAVFISAFITRLRIRKTYIKHNCTIQFCIVTMLQSDSNFNYFYGEIFKKSLFTERQISIIYKRLTEHSRVKDISSGAYYRQLKQCRNKINSILYSILLLRLTGAVDSQALFAIEKISSQLSVMSVSKKSNRTKEDNHVQDVISVIYRVVDTMSKV